MLKYRKKRSMYWEWFSVGGVLAENAEGAEKEFCVFIFMRMTDLNTAALYIFMMEH